MSDHPKVPVHFARELGSRIIEQITTDVHRVERGTRSTSIAHRAEILGSIRRGKPWVSDIEILVEPIRYPTQTDLFGEVQEWAAPMYDRIALLKRFGMFEDRISKTGQAADGPRAKRFWAITNQWDVTTDLPDPGTGNKPDRVAVDIFICVPPSQWGVSSIIRTGPYLYSTWFVTGERWGGPLPQGWRVKDNCLVTDTGEVLETPTEQDVYDALDLDYVPPDERERWWRQNVRAADAAGGVR